VGPILLCCVVMEISTGWGGFGGGGGYTQDNLEIKKSLDLHEKSLDLSNYEIFQHKSKKHKLEILEKIRQNMNVRVLSNRI
jgi:hypothetical protein